VDRFYGGRGGDVFRPGDIPAVKDVVNSAPGIVTAHTDEADVVGNDHERVKTVKDGSFPHCGHCVLPVQSS
jgi:hypothetical protein